MSWQDTGNTFKLRHQFLVNVKSSGSVEYYDIIHVSFSVLHCAANYSENVRIIRLIRPEERNFCTLCKNTELFNCRRSAQIARYNEGIMRTLEMPRKFHGACCLSRTLKTGHEYYCRRFWRDYERRSLAHERN